MQQVDTRALVAAAARVEDLAAVVRARRQLVAVHAARLEWRSPAARLFLNRVDEAVGNLSDCANRLDALAEGMRAHAVRVAHRP